MGEPLDALVITIGNVVGSFSVCRCQTMLANIEGIAFCYLTDKDVVRHPLVQKIIAAYDRYNRQKTIHEKGGDKKW